MWPPARPQAATDPRTDLSPPSKKPRCGSRDPRPTGAHSHPPVALPRAPRLPTHRDRLGFRRAAHRLPRTTRRRHAHSSGVLVPLDKLAPVKDEAVRQRLREEVRDRVRQVSLAELGVEPMPLSDHFRGRNCSKVSRDRERLPLSRWPDAGRFARIKTVLDNGIEPPANGTFVYRENEPVIGRRRSKRGSGCADSGACPGSSRRCASEHSTRRKKPLPWPARSQRHRLNIPPRRQQRPRPGLRRRAVGGRQSHRGKSAPPWNGPRASPTKVFISSPLRTRANCS